MLLSGSYVAKALKGKELDFLWSTAPAMGVMLAETYRTHVLKNKASTFLLRTTRRHVSVWEISAKIYIVGIL